MKLAPALLSALILVTACGRQDPPAPKPDPKGPSLRHEMLVEAHVLPEIQKGRDLLLLHVSKTRDTYDTEHLPGARYLAWDRITTSRDGADNEVPDDEALTALARELGITPDTSILLYDDGTGIFACRAYLTFTVMGLDSQTSVLNGQLAGWKAIGMPVTAEVPPARTTSSIDLSVNREPILPFDGIEGFQRSGGVFLDARPEVNYTGAEPGKGITRGGHIPGARCLTWDSFILSAENPVFRSQQELRDQLEDLAADTKLATYCRTGGQASLTWFVLRYLGHDVRLYDGSWQEWSAKPDTPVETPDP